MTPQERELIDAALANDSTFVSPRMWNALEALRGARNSSPKWWVRGEVVTDGCTVLSASNWGAPTGPGATQRICEKVCDLLNKADRP